MIHPARFHGASVSRSEGSTRVARRGESPPPPRPDSMCSALALRVQSALGARRTLRRTPRNRCGTNPAEHCSSPRDERDERRTREGRDEDDRCREGCSRQHLLSSPAAYRDEGGPARRVGDRQPDRLSVASKERTSVACRFEAENEERAADVRGERCAGASPASSQRRRSGGCGGLTRRGRRRGGGRDRRLGFGWRETARRLRWGLSASRGPP